MSFINIYNKNIPGMFEFASNTLGLNGACTSFANIHTGCNNPGTSGIAGAWITIDPTKSANANWANFVNNLPFASTNGGTTFDCTQNSSSDEINIPQGTTIDFAFLAWSGNSLSGNVDVSTRSVNLTSPDNTLYSITPDNTFFDTSGYGYYTCYKDVTDIIKNTGNGDYVVGNVYSEFQTDIAAASWLLFIVYTSPYMPFINININLGNLSVSGNYSPSTLLSGFETPLDNNFKAGIILTALNGNPASGGDQVSLTDINNNPFFLSGKFNPENNFFGSQIMYLDGEICTDGTFSNLNTTPNMVQTTPGRRIGYDLAIVDAANVLSPGQSSTTLTGSTTGNNYCLTSAILIVQDACPEFKINATTSNNVVLLGHNYTVTYNIENIGTKGTSNLELTYDDTGLTFVSGSYTVLGITYPIASTPNGLVLPNLDINESMTVTLTYTSTKIPDSLYYDNAISLDYSFEIASSTTLQNTIAYNYIVNISNVTNLDVINVTPVYSDFPLVNPLSSNIVYTLTDAPAHGQAVINQSSVTYTPSTLQQIDDIFVIKVTNTILNTSVNLVYDVDQIVVPMINISVDQPSTVNLFSTVDSIITLENTSSFPMTNIQTVSFLAPGFLLIDGEIVSDIPPFDMVRTTNKFTIGDLDPNSSVSWMFTFEAVQLSTDLLYSIGGNLTFDFGGQHFESSGGSDFSPSNTFTPISNIVKTIYANTTFDEVIPIIEPHYPHLSYSIKTQGALGTATVSALGMVTYTPQPNVTGTDSFVVAISNSQLNTNIDVNYLFTIEKVAPPCPDDLPYKLVTLLNEDIYLKALERNGITADICFDCNLWNVGYTDTSGELIIPPIKTALTTIFAEIETQLQDILSSTSLNVPCSDCGFTTQVSRLLNIVEQIGTQISFINCNPASCDPVVWANLLAVLSDTLDILIAITSTLDGLLGICSHNCTDQFNNLMVVFINSITDLYNTLQSWNDIGAYFNSIK